MKLLNSLILSLCLTITLQFSCSDIASKDYCIQLNGCSWSHSKCKGDIDQPCETEKCIFIFPLTKSKTRSGSIKHPFKTIAGAISSIEDAKNATIYGINLPDAAIKENAFSITVPNCTVTILPLFSNHRLTIHLSTNFNLFDLTILQFKSCSLILENLNQVLFTDDLVETEEAPCMLSFEDVDILSKDDQVNSKLSEASLCDLKLKNIEYSGTILPFYFREALVAKEYFSTIHISNLKFTSENHVSRPFLISYDANITITDSEFFNIHSNELETTFAGPALFTLKKGTIKFNNVSFWKVRQNIIRYEGSKISINNTSFGEIKAQKIIELRKGDFLYPEIVIKNTNFYNVSVSYSVVLTEMDTAFDNSSMTNITYIPPKKENLLSNKGRGVCAFVIDANLVVLKSIFHDIRSNCFYVNSYGIDIEESIFYNPRIHNGYKINAYQEESHFIIADSSLLVEQYISEDFPFTILVNQTIFVSERPNEINNGAIKITGNLDNVAFKMLLSNFVGLYSSQGGAIQVEKEFSQIQGISVLVNDSIFYNCSSESSGGAIAQQRKDEQASQFSNLLFVKNRARTIGGALSILNTSAVVSKSVFVQNLGQYGGALSYLKKDVNFFKNSFVNNGAETIGGAILTMPKLAKNILGIGQNIQKNLTKAVDMVDYDNWILNLYNFHSNFNLFEDGIDFYTLLNGNDSTFSKLFSYNSTYNESNITALNLNVIPGHPLPNIIEIVFFEKDGSISTYLEDYRFQVFFQSNIEVYPSTSAYINHGKLYIYHNIKASGYNQEYQTLFIRSEDNTRNIISQLSQQLVINITVTMQPCMQGDIKDEVNKGCLPCPNHLYSLENPDNSEVQCQRCPQNMICLGGNVILPDRGYYKYSSESSTPIKCLNEDACDGGIQNFLLNENGFCKKPFDGNLCTQCLPGYMSSPDGSECYECSVNFWFYLKVIGKLAVAIGLILYSIKKKIEKGNLYREAHSKGDDEKVEELNKQFDFSCALKLTFTLLQMISIVKVINYEWNSQLSKFYEFSSRVAPSIVHQFSSKCWFLQNDIDPQTTFYYQFLMTVLSPLVILILLVPIILLIYCRNQSLRKEFTESIKLSILIIFYIEQPQVLFEALSLFKCRELSPDHYYLQSNLDIRCFTPSYYKWAFGLGLPILLIWGVFYPFYLFITMYKQFKQNQTSKHELYAKFSFIIAGYLPQRYYWEFGIIIRKLLMIIVVIGITETDQVTQGAFLFLILGLSLYLHNVSNIYQSEKVASLDKLSILSVMVMIFLGIYFQQSASTPQELLSASQHILVYILTGLGILLVLVCLIQLMLLAITGYRGKIRQGLLKLSLLWGKKSIEKEADQDTIETTYQKLEDKSDIQL